MKLKETASVICNCLRSSIINPTLSLIYPEQCLFCKIPLRSPSSTEATSHICQDCSRRLQFKPDIRRDFTLNGIPVDYLLSLGTHENIIRNAIIELKFNKRFNPIGVVWEKSLQINEEILDELRSAEVILPVPLHWLRRLRRGFNQADVIGRMLSQSLNVPVKRDYLIRRKRTKSMPGLDRYERIENVKDAFCVIGESGLYNSAVLVDDVMTTGATISSCAGVLITAGVEKVYAFTVSRSDL